MSIIHKAFKGALWLGIFKAISQTFSWAATIIVARILVPGDYGLMEMATIMTGYVALFGELGLGAAIIQKEKINDEELSSLFWFIVFWSSILAIICILLAYPTVAIFNESRLLRVTQSVSILFIIGSFIIVPLNILNRELRFKTIGIIDAISVIISCLAMIMIARLGGGVWTLIGGNIIRDFSRSVLIFSLSSWRHKLHFNFKEIKSYLRFGLNVTGTTSLHYIISKSDRFYGGLTLGASTLGYYSFAVQLSAIPNDKFIFLIKSVSFPVFSRYQNNYFAFNKFYLKLVKIIAFITFPLYIGGIFIADQLVPLVVGEKWMAMIFPFKLLCLSNVIMSIATPNGIANSAQGRPHWGFYMALVSVFIMPLSFFIASKYGLKALAIPWITIYPLFTFIFTWITINKLGISIFQYLRSLIHPLLATVSMVITLSLVKYLYFSLFVDPKPYLFIAIIIGVLSYSIYILTFQRPLLTSFLNLRKG